LLNTEPSGGLIRTGAARVDWGVGAGGDVGVGAGDDVGVGAGDDVGVGAGGDVGVAVGGPETGGVVSGT